MSKLQEKYPIVSKADAHSSQWKFTINTKVDGDAFCTYHSDLTTIVKEAELRYKQELQNLVSKLFKRDSH